MDLVRPLFQRPALVRTECRSPVPLDQEFPILPDQIMSRHQFFQPTEKCILSRHISQAQVDLQHLLVQFLFEARLLHDLTDHGPVEKLSVLCLIIIERLRSEVIPQTEQLPLLIVPQRKRKHSVHMVRHLISPCLISFNEDLLLPLLSRQVQRKLQALAEFLPVSDVSPVFFYCYHM